MCPFIPKVYSEIFQEASEFLAASTKIKDFNRGSVARTICESLSYEVDELYYQLALLKTTFSILSASGSALDSRAAEYGVRRQQAASSFGYTQFTVESVVGSRIVSYGNLVPLVSDYVNVEDSSSFPVLPYNIKIGEGTENEEILSVSDNDPITGILTTSLASKPHIAGELVTVITGQDTYVPAGVGVLSPGTSTSAAVEYITTAGGIITSGNRVSNYVPTISVITGSHTNKGMGQITRFSKTPPPNIKGVTNVTAFSSGRDVETDEQFRQRTIQKIQALGRGTRQAIETELLGVVDPNTKQRVTSLKLLERPSTSDVLAYIDDGSGTAAISNLMAQTILADSCGSSADSVEVNSISKFPAFGSVLLSPEDSSQTEIIEYSVSATGTELKFGGAGTCNAHDKNDVAFAVDVLVDSAELGAKYLKTQMFPMIEESLRVWADYGGTGVVTELVEGTNYEVNMATGEIEIIYPAAGLPAGSKVAAHYSYYTGILATVQKLIDGDPSSPTNYPGLKALGTKFLPASPTRKMIPFQLSIVAIKGYREEDLTDLVVNTVLNYVSSLGVGENVILSEIVQRVKAITVNGVEVVDDVKILSPTANVIVLESELAATDTAHIVVL